MNFVKKVFVTLRSISRHPLTGKSKSAAMWNFCISQVAARMVPGDTCVSFPNGTKLLISPRMKGAAHFIVPGLCEFDEMSFVMHFLRPGDLFVDVGANVGAYTVLASGVAGANTVSFEPSASSYEFLRRNVQLNGMLDKVATHNVALGSEHGVARFTEGLGTENHLSADGDLSGTREVKVEALDTMLQGLKPTLLKIDVEGFETRVLAGATQTLREPSLQAFIVERSNLGTAFGFDENKLHGEIRALSFTPTVYSPLSRSLTRLPDEALGNIIYVRDFAAAQRRLKEALPYEFGGHKV